MQHKSVSSQVFFNMAVSVIRNQSMIALVSAILDRDFLRLAQRPHLRRLVRSPSVGDPVVEMMSCLPPRLLSLESAFLDASVFAR